MVKFLDHFGYSRKDYLTETSMLKDAAEERSGKALDESIKTLTAAIQEKEKGRLEKAEQRAIPDHPEITSEDYYDWIDSALFKAGVPIGGNPPKGTKQIGKNIEMRLYHSLQEAVGEYLGSLKGTETKAEVLAGVREILGTWLKENLPIAEKAFEELFRRGFSAGAIASGLPGKMGISDVNAMEVLKDGKYHIGERISLFADEAVKEFQGVIGKAYTPEGKFDLPTMVREMHEAVPAQRYKLERIARTETAQVSNIGRLWGWEQDPDKFFYDYHWSSVPDKRRKTISKLRSEGGPYSWPEIKFLWLHQEELLDGKWQADQYNQRCTITRSPRNDESKRNRFAGREDQFRNTAEVTF